MILVVFFCQIFLLHTVYLCHDIDENDIMMSGFHFGKISKITYRLGEFII